MAYIGRGTDNISNVEVLDNITFNGNSSYTLQKGGANYVPVSANNILVSIDGVVQANNFSVSSSTIDFGTAVTGTCNFVLHFGTGLITTVQDGAVTTAKIGDDAVTYAKLQNLATANRVLGSTSTGLIGETQIATAMVSDDAITYAKMQDTSTANRILGAASAGTIGEVQVATDMIADAQVDEAKLKISNAPTNGYFLSAQSGNTGGLTWAVAGGSLVKLASTTISSGVAAVSFNNSYITSTYDNYRVIAYGLSTASDNQDIALRMSVDNGSNFATHVGCFNYSQINAGSVVQNTVGNRSSIPLGSDEEADASGATNFIIDLMNLNSTTQYKYANGMGVVNNQTNSDYYGYRVHGYITSNTAVNFFKIFTEAGGNLDAGTITLYGYEK